jgi:hypothetical protein
MARRRKSRGLAGTAHSPASLKTQAKACGSHYFDADSMRFFNARLLGVYPVPGKDVTYFVEGKGGGSRGLNRSVPRHYTVGVFKNCRVESIGKRAAGSGKADYRSAAKAKKIARAIQSKAMGYGTTLKTRKRKRK